MKKLHCILLLVLLPAIGGCLNTAVNSVLIRPVDANALIRNDSTIVVLDVRTPAEFSGGMGHLANALLIPVQDIDRRIDELQPYKDRQIIVYCRSGRRSTTASEILQKKGYNVRNLEGGITRWIADSLPVVRETH